MSCAPPARGNHLKGHGLAYPRLRRPPRTPPPPRWAHFYRGAGESCSNPKKSPPPPPPRAMCHSVTHYFGPCSCRAVSVHGSGTQHKVLQATRQGSTKGYRGVGGLHKLEFLHFNFCTPPPPCPSPPLVLPRGGGGRHLLNPKFFVAAHCVVVAKPPPKSAAQSKVVSMCKSSRSSGAGPRKFTPSWSRSRSPYVGSPLKASCAEFFRFMLQFLCLQMCVYGGSAAVRDRLPWGGEGQRGGGTKFCSVFFRICAGNNSKRPLFLMSNCWDPYIICSLFFKKWHRFCHARICRFISSPAWNAPPPPRPTRHGFALAPFQARAGHSHRPAARVARGMREGARQRNALIAP